MAGPLGGRTTTGRLRHRLKLQKLADAPDREEGGQEVEAWSDVATVRGEVVAASGRELFASAQVQAQVSHRVVMRRRSDVDERRRFVWLDNGSAVLNVVAVLTSIGRKDFIEVWCLQGKHG